MAKTQILPHHDGNGKRILFPGVQNAGMIYHKRFGLHTGFLSGPFIIHGERGIKNPATGKIEKYRYNEFFVMIYEN